MKIEITITDKEGEVDNFDLRFAKFKIEEAERILEELYNLADTMKL